MKLRGKIKSIAKNIINGHFDVTIEMTEGDAHDIASLADKDLSVELKQWRNHRSLDANALLWACIGDMVKALGGDKWDYYIKYLREYGQYTMIQLQPDALEQFKKVYRECEVIGSRYVDGKEMLQVLCYYGSSTYDTKEFSVLLDGVIQDMKHAGVEPPTSEEMKRSLEMWENEQKIKKRVH